MRVKQSTFRNSLNQLDPDIFKLLLSIGKYEETSIYGNFSHTVTYTLLEFS